MSSRPPHASAGQWRLRGAVGVLRLGGAVVSALCASCSMSLGPVGTYAVAAQPSQHDDSWHAGVQGSAFMQWPRDYKVIVGGESAVLGQFSPGTDRDQWRAGVLVGYGWQPDAYGSRVGFEVLLKGGFVRGDIGDVRARGGLYGGARIGVPIRIGEQAAPARYDGTIQPFVMVVPELGFQPIVAFREHGASAAFFEPFVGLSARLRLTSGLVP